MWGCILRGYNGIPFFCYMFVPQNPFTLQHTYMHIPLENHCQALCAHQCTAASCRCTHFCCQQGQMFSSPLSFIGMKESLPLDPIIDSLMESSREGGVVGLLKILDQWIREGSDLEQGSWPGWPFLTYLLLSFRCKDFRREAVSLDDLTVNSSYLYNGTMATGMWQITFYNTQHFFAFHALYM